MIPVIINNRNRLTTLKGLIDWLNGLDVKIIVLDNDSTYPPLLDYYRASSVEVVHLGKNLGHTAIYHWGGHLNFPYFIYTDPDLLPRDDCPRDLIDYLVSCKKQYPSINKVGAGIEVRDIPDDYPFKEEVLRNETPFWKHRMGDLFSAKIDTTFAVWSNDSLASHRHCLDNCLRTDYPYVIRHLPWYKTVLDDEERYYLKHATARWEGVGATANKFVGKWTQKIRKHLLKEIKL